MKHRALVLLVALAAWPAAAAACGACVDSQFRYLVPAWYGVVGALFLWAVADAVMTAVWGNVSVWPVVWVTAGVLVLLLVASGMLGVLPVLVVAVGRLAWVARDVTKRRETAVRPVLRGRVAVIMTALVVVYAGVQQARHASLDPLDRYLALVGSGTASARSLSRKLGKDASLDVERLRPHLAADSPTRDLALEVLLARARREDAVQLSEALLAFPDEAFAGDHYGEFFYVNYYLDELGVPEPRSREVFVQWLEEGETG